MHHRGGHRGGHRMHQPRHRRHRRGGCCLPIIMFITGVALVIALVV